MTLFKWLGGGVMGLMLVSCVTINIYFPEAAAEKAADKIIGDVWSEEAKPSEAPVPAEQSKPISSLPTKSTNTPIAISVLNWLISPAAAEANLKINSSAVNSIKERMKARFENLKTYYDNGAVGLTQNGLITLRDAKVVPLKDRNTINSLVADENKDRSALYAEIARANDHPEWQADIQATFAQRWISNATAGWWYQTNGKWQQK